MIAHATINLRLALLAAGAQVGFEEVGVQDRNSYWPTKKGIEKIKIQKLKKNHKCVHSRKLKNVQFPM